MLVDWIYGAYTIGTDIEMGLVMAVPLGTLSVAAIMN
jgi:hypothetical protein